MLDDRHYMRSEYRPPWSMTAILLVTNIAIFLLQEVLNLTVVGDRFLSWFALSVDGLQHWRIYQLLTFQFLHASLWHLFGNMLGLYFFGRAMEESLGRNGMLRLYFLSGTLGGLLQIALGFMLPDRYGSLVVGASAGVFGLVAAFAVSRPNQPITLLIFFVIPVTFAAKFILAFEAVVAIWGVLVPSGMVAHAAHLGGMLTGIAYILWFSDSSGSRWEWLRFFRRGPSGSRIITPPRRTWRSSARIGTRLGTEDLPPAEFISRKVDPILEKISAQGIHSLTEEERQILEAARSRMARR